MFIQPKPICATTTDYRYNAKLFYTTIANHILQHELLHATQHCLLLYYKHLCILPPLILNAAPEPIALSHAKHYHTAVTTADKPVLVIFIPQS